MFNRTIINTPSTQQVRVEEHRAPTDDSIRLFSEYREKAIKSVLDAGTESMSIDQVQWVVMEAPEVYGVRLYLTFFVDGKKCTEEITVQKRDLFGSLESKFEAIENRIRDHVVRAVSRELHKQLATVSYELAKSLEKHCVR